GAHTSRDCLHVRGQSDLSRLMLTRAAITQTAERLGFEVVAFKAEEGMRVDVQLKDVYVGRPLTVSVWPFTREADLIRTLCLEAATWRGCAPQMAGQDAWLS